MPPLYQATHTTSVRWLSNGQLQQASTRLRDALAMSAAAVPDTCVPCSHSDTSQSRHADFSARSRASSSSDAVAA